MAETDPALAKLRATYERMADATVRRDEGGWRFYDIQGRSFALGAAEGAALRGEAQARIDGLFRSLNGSSWVLLLFAAAVGMVMMRMANEFLVAGGMPSVVYLIPCVALLFGDAANEIRFAFAMLAWREETASALRRRDGREAEATTYACIFDPRMPRWAGFGLGALALACLAAIAGLPALPTLAVIIGVGMVGRALLA